MKIYDEEIQHNEVENTLVGYFVGNLPRIKAAV